MLAFIVSGCATYTTPGGNVELNLLADEDINSLMSKQPAANFPANLAVARIQSTGYSNYQLSSYGQGKFSVVISRDVESEEDFSQIAKLSNIAGVAPLNKLFLPTKLDSIKSLRLAAARLKADILMLYTFDTSFHVGAQKYGPLNVISLGFLNNKEINVITTVTAAFFDVRTEYLYGISEATAKQRKWGSVWGTGAVVDDLRVLTEKRHLRVYFPKSKNRGKV